MDTRYVAEWITKQYFDEIGEWQSDRDEIKDRVYKSLAAAQKGGIIASRKAGAMEWVRVKEQELRRLGDDLGSYTVWDTVRSFTGDWSGEWDEA